MISNRARQKAGPLVAKVCLGDKEWGINWDGIIRLPEAKSVKDAFVLKLETWSEKGGYVCAVLCLVAQSCPTLCKPTDPPGSSLQARQAPLSIEFSSQAYWSGLPFPPAEDLPDPGIKPISPALTDGLFYH